MPKVDTTKVLTILDFKRAYPQWRWEYADKPFDKSFRATLNDGRQIKVRPVDGSYEVSRMTRGGWDACEWDELDAQRQPIVLSNSETEMRLNCGCVIDKRGRHTVRRPCADHWQG